MNHEKCYFFPKSPSVAFLANEVRVPLLDASFRPAGLSLRRCDSQYHFRQFRPELAVHQVHTGPMELGLNLGSKEGVQGIFLRNVIIRYFAKNWQHRGQNCQSFTNVSVEFVQFFVNLSNSVKKVDEMCTKHGSCA